MLNCALADAAVTADVRGYWKGPADLRASGLTTWVRDHSGRIRNAPVLRAAASRFSHHRRRCAAGRVVMSRC